MMTKLFGRVGYANLAATAAVVVAAGALAVAAIPGPDGVIHGCYKKKSGKLRVVEAGIGCRRNEVAIAWNQQGVPGAPGAQGETGSPGADGAPATALWAVVNSLGYYQRGSGVAVPVGTDLSAIGNRRKIPFDRDITSCSWVALIGGASINSGVVDGFITASAGPNPNEITVTMKNETGSAIQNQDFHLAVFC